jgi:hypothetical protein
LYRKLAALRDQCLSSPQPNRKQLGAILAAALSPPLRNETFLVGDHVVTSSWAFGADRDTSSAIVDIGEPAKPEPSPQTPAAAASQAGERPTLSESPASETRIETRPRVPPNVYAVAGPRWFRMVLAAAAALVIASGAIYGVATWRNNTAQALRAEQETGDALRLKLAAMRQALADRKLNCNRMRFPTSLSMLSGRWKNVNRIWLDKHPDVTLPHHLEFHDDGTGQLRIDASNGDICKADFHLQFVPNVRLGIVTGPIVCEGPKPMTINSETWTCTPAPGGFAKCHIESGSNKINDDFVRE